MEVEVVRTHTQESPGYERLFNNIRVDTRRSKGEKNRDYKLLREDLLRKSETRWG